MSGKKVVSIQTKSRNTWIDGLKGIACFQVFFNHFMCSFYPAYYLSGEQIVHTNGFEKWLAYSPLNMLLEGEMFVAIFCLVSGLFLTLKVMGLKDKSIKLSEIIVGRYFRLVLPVVPIGALVCLMTRLNFFSNEAAAQITGSEWLGSFYNRPLGVVETLSSVLIKTWFYGDDTLSTAFWMLPQMFIGSFLAILLGIIYWKMPKKSVWIYAFVALALIPRHDYVVVFAIGAIFAWMLKENQIDFLRRIDSKGVAATVVGVLCVLIAHIVAGYPIQLEPKGIYVYMNLGFNDLWRVIGGTLLVFGIWNVGIFQKFLSLPIFKNLGGLCYEFYIIHIPLLFSVGTSIFMILTDWGLSYNVAGIVNFVLTFGITIACAYFYSKYISRLCVNAENYILQFFVK